MPTSMRALVVTNMYPTPERPAFGRFVYDQVSALRSLGVDLEVFAFSGRYVRAAGQLARRYRAARFDVVHAHFGLTTWPALAVRARARAVTLHGSDLAIPRSRAVTLAGLRFVDLVGVVSDELGASVPGSARVEVLPCGVDLERFRVLDRAEARAALGLAADGRYVLFPADPARPEKRYDLARAVAGDGATILTLGAVSPERVPLYVNASDAVLVPSDREGFGLAVLEALACDVPVLATPHGIAPEALAGVDGAYCGAFDADRWRAELRRVLAVDDPRLVAGRAVAERYSSVAMARRVLEAWRRVVSR